MNWRRVKKQFQARTPKHEAMPEFSGFCLFAVSVLGFYCFLFPHLSGPAGAQVVRTFGRGIGKLSYLLWFLLGYRGLRLMIRREQRRPWRYVFVDLLLLTAACSLVTSFGALFLDVNHAGFLGKFSSQILAQSFGNWGALFISSFAFIGVLLWRSGRRPRDLIVWFWARLISDWQEWRQAVAIEREKQRSAPNPVAVRKPMPKVAAVPDIPSQPIVRMRETVPPPKYTPPVVAAKPERSAPVKKEESSAPVAAGSNEPSPFANFKRPSLDLLKTGERPPMAREEDLLASAQHLEKTLLDFGVEGKVVEIHPGPIITRFDFTPAPGIKVQAVANLANDIALAMKALSVRVVAPIPGKSAVGIELPNVKRAVVRLREVLESEPFQNNSSKIALGLGKDAEGHPYVADLASMPHMLIAGSTGSGKSVCIHAVVMSLIYRCTPDEVKLLLIDPKRLELPLYNGIPYLYDPNQNPENVRVITDAKEAAKALEGMIKVMDHRFKKLASVMARDLTHYNEKMAAEGRPKEPFIVVIIDELADLMAVAPKEVEGSIQRLTQMARAVGIHLILATQRPSVDVITGVIKANLPARLAFRVASQTDSRVILDGSGAESLLGEGDLLFLPPGAPKPSRMQGGFITSNEVQRVTEFVRAQGNPSYERVMTLTAAPAASGNKDADEQEEDLRQALMLVLERRRVSQDLLKAHFGSSARATDLLSLLEVKGFISKPEGTNRWTIFFDRIDAYLGQVKNQAPVS